MFYTTYFARLKQLPANIVPVAICAKVPEWYTGLTYSRLAPTYEILKAWKKYGDVKAYTDKFYREVLDNLIPHIVCAELAELTLSMDIALVCYETSNKFCHRHLIASWLREAGIGCCEWEPL